MFNITVDPVRKMVRVETSGLGTVEEVAEFARRQEAVLDMQGWRSGEFWMLWNTIDNITQPQNVMQALQNLLYHTPRKPHRLAVVKGGAVAGMQTRRVLTTDHAAHFATIVEAEKWLSSCPPLPTKLVEAR